MKNTPTKATLELKKDFIVGILSQLCGIQQK